MDLSTLTLGDVAQLASAFVALWAADIARRAAQIANTAAASQKLSAEAQHKRDYYRPVVVEPVLKMIQQFIAESTADFDLYLHRFRTLPGTSSIDDQKHLVGEALAVFNSRFVPFQNMVTIIVSSWESEQLQEDVALGLERLQDQVTASIGRVSDATVRDENPSLTLNREAASLLKSIVRFDREPTSLTGPL